MHKKICIVGCGHIAKVHAKNLRPHCELSFHSRHIASAQRYNLQFGGRGIYPRFEDVLNDRSIDGLIISSPPAYHTDQIIAALQQDKFVMVDKPLCISSQELNHIKSTLDNSALNRLMVGENYYYKPSVAKLKQLIRADAIGRIHTINVKKVFKQDSESWKKKLGALLEGGIHFIALISAILEDTPLRVSAVFPNQASHEIERHSLTYLHYPNNIHTCLHYAWDTNHLGKGLFQHSSLAGSKGKIIFESNGLYVILKSKKKIYLPGYADIAGFKAMSLDFLTCVEKQSRPRYHFAKAQRDLNIVFQAYDHRLEDPRSKTRKANHA